jgi:hypothetical protein
MIHLADAIKSARRVFERVCDAASRNNESKKETSLSEAIHNEACDCNKHLWPLYRAVSVKALQSVYFWRGSMNERRRNQVVVRRRRQQIIGCHSIF